MFVMKLRKEETFTVMDKIWSRSLQMINKKVDFFWFKVAAKSSIKLKGFKSFTL